MNEEKHWYESKTVIAGIVAVILSVLGLAGVGGLEDQKETIVELLLQAITAIAGIVAIWGRVTAKKSVK